MNLGPKSIIKGLFGMEEEVGQVSGKKAEDHVQTFVSIGSVGGERQPLRPHPQATGDSSPWNVSPCLFFAQPSYTVNSNVDTQRIPPRSNWLFPQGGSSIDHNVLREEKGGKRFCTGSGFAKSRTMRCSSPAHESTHTSRSLHEKEKDIVICGPLVAGNHKA